MAFSLPGFRTFEMQRVLRGSDFVADCVIMIIFVNVFFLFYFSCSGQGDTFMDPALLDNLREHHVST